MFAKSQTEADNLVVRPYSFAAKSLSNVSGYINSGGLGTRLNLISPPDSPLGVTKALLEIGQPPISLIDHHINRLRSGGIESIIAGVGHHSNVAKHIDVIYGSNNGVRGVYFDKQLGTGGDLIRAVRAESELFNDDVLVLNVDTILDIDEAEFLYVYRKTQSDLTIALTENLGVPNEGAYHINYAEEVVFSAEAETLPRGGLKNKEIAYKASSTGAIFVKKQLLYDYN